MRTTAVVEFLSSYFIRGTGRRLLFPLSLSVGGLLSLGVPLNAVAAPATPQQASAASLFPVIAPSVDASVYFVEAPEYTVGAQRPRSVIVADVNGDHIPDMVVASFCNSVDCGNGAISILLGNGDETFQVPVVYDSGGNGTISFAAGDVNGDGKPDLVVANQSNTSNTIGVLLGNGDGTFKPAVAYSVGTQLVSGIALADMDSDGKLDAVAAINCVKIEGLDRCLDGGVAVLLGNGNGTFRPPVTYSAADTMPYSVVTSVAVGDLNGDGKPDVIAGTSSGAAVLLGNGNGTLQAAIPYSSGGTDTTSVAVADLNRDGHLDVVLGDYSGVAVLRGNGDGTLQTSRFYAMANVTSVQVADVNSDGVPDVLATGSEGGDGSAIALLGNGDGTLRAPVAYSTNGSYPSSVAVADLNLDGKPDLVATAYCVSTCGPADMGSVSVLLGNGNGSFQAAPVLTDPAGGEIGATADVNGDGILDLLSINYASATGFGNVGVRLGRGDGTFLPVVQYSTAGAVFPNQASLVVADVNGDGRPDVLVLNEDSVAVLLGNGDGTFQPAVKHPPATGTLPSNWLAVADVNGDGKADVAVSVCVRGVYGCIGGGVDVFLGNGDGTFKNAVAYPAGNTAICLAIADLSADGKPDLVVSDQGKVGVLLGNGDGTFQPIVQYPSTPVGSFPQVAVADVNGDGKLDVLVLDRAYLAVLLGNGDGTLQAAELYPTPGFPTEAGLGSLAVADFNGDGKLDVASGEENFLLLGNGDGSFQNFIYLGVADYGLAVGDFNGDGTPDLAVGPGVIFLNRPSPIEPTSTVLVSSLSPSYPGQAVTYVATVSPSGNVPPTGTVTFDINGNKPVTESLVNGQATFPWTFQYSGTRMVAAQYSGDAHNARSLSATLTQVVSSQSSTQTSIVSSTNPSLAGQQVTFTATLLSQSGPTPTGTVSFTISGNKPVSVPVSNGQAIFNWSFQAAGNRTITASYSGDASNLASTSAALAQTVNPAPGTTTGLSSSLNPSAPNQVVTYTASVTGHNGAPTGSVTFTINGNKPVTATLVNGQATFNWTFLNAGSRTVIAAYSGDAANQPSNSPTLNQTISAKATTTVLTSSPNPSTVNQSVAYTAVVTSQNGGTPTGTVSFTINGNKPVTQTLANGQAVFNWTFLNAGSRSVTASYSGDAQNAPSSSVAVNQTVN